GQVDVLAFGGDQHAAGADQDAGDRALHATDDAADDRANAGARADLADFTLEAFALDRVGDRRPDVGRAPVNRQSRELDGHAALAIRARCLVDRGHVADEQRPGRNHQIVSLVEIDDRRGLDAILDNRSLRRQRRLQAHVKLDACGYRAIEAAVAALTAVAVVAAPVVRRAPA